MTTIPQATPNDASGSYYVIVDVEIRDLERYRAYMEKVRPALEGAGGRYLVRGGAHNIYEGDWQPARLVLLEFPSRDAWESFYHGPAYEGIKAIRDEVSTARLVGVEGVLPTF